VHTATLIPLPLLLAAAATGLAVLVSLMEFRPWPARLERLRAHAKVPAIWILLLVASLGIGLVITNAFLSVVLIITGLVVSIFLGLQGDSWWSVGWFLLALVFSVIHFTFGLTARDWRELPPPEDFPEMTLAAFDADPSLVSASLTEAI